MADLTLTTPEDARYVEDKSLVGLCMAEVVVTSKIKSGEAICPVTQGTISLEKGICQETSCRFHSER